MTLCHVGMFETKYLHLDVQCLLKKSLRVNMISLLAVEHAHHIMGRGHLLVLAAVYGNEHLLSLPVMKKCFS